MNAEELLGLVFASFMLISIKKYAHKSNLTYRGPPGAVTPVDSTSLPFSGLTFAALTPVFACCTQDGEDVKKKKSSPLYFSYLI